MSADPNVLKFDTAAAFLARLPEETRLNVAHLLLKELADNAMLAHPGTAEMCGGGVERGREVFYEMIRASQDEGDAKALAVMCTWLVMHADKKLLTGLMYFIEHEDEEEPQRLQLIKNDTTEQETI